MTELLTVEGVSVHYGGTCAVNDVTLQVSPGEFVGLIGPNGAGKTSFIDGITGFTPASGEVHFAGTRIDRLAPHRRSGLGLARTFQSLELFDDLTVVENVAIGAAQPISWWELVGRSSPLPASVSWALDLFDLGPLESTSVLNLSHGQRKLVTLARALASQPAMVLLDEPAAGLDSTESLALGRTLQRVREAGVTVLLVDHDMGLVMDVCEVVYVMDFGALIAEGPVASIQADPRVVDAYLGAGHHQEDRA